MEAIALHPRINSDHLSACGFRYPASDRTLQDFDQIMTEAGLWEFFRDETYRINVDDGIINEAGENYGQNLAQSTTWYQLIENQYESTVNLG